GPCRRGRLDRGRPAARVGRRGGEPAGRPARRRGGGAPRAPAGPRHAGRDPRDAQRVTRRPAGRPGRPDTVATTVHPPEATMTTTDAATSTATTGSSAPESAPLRPGRDETARLAARVAVPSTGRDQAEVASPLTGEIVGTVPIGT